MSDNKPVILLILDGWGHRTEREGNAIAAANTPIWDNLMQNVPHSLLHASGEEVGLPAGQMGNSEVGHLTMGAGRVLYQDLTRISKSIENRDFFKNPVLLNTFEQSRVHNRSVHVLCLLSNGGVHSHEDHLFACLTMAKANQIEKLYVHAFLDGRDTPPQSAFASLEKLNTVLTETGFQLASISGRYFAMDRDQRWDRVQKAYQAIVLGNSDFYAQTATEALTNAYARGESDEFVTPTCLLMDQKPVCVQENDSVIFMNFRSDRARALSYAITSPNFTAFERTRVPLSRFVTLTEYDKNLNAEVVFGNEPLVDVLGEYLAKLKLTQLHIAETEKYAHVTFFFNGGRELPFVGEERILIPSPKVATYDLQPQMSAPEITAALIKQIDNNQFDFIVCNFANADMVGHTGNFNATVQAIETLDECLGQILAALKRKGGQALITADHGNAECMVDHANNQAHTAHTTAWVPLVYVGDQSVTFLPEYGTLSDIAPTLLFLMGLPVPPAMTGKILLKFNTALNGAAQ